MPLPNWEGRRPHPVITKVDSVSPCGERSYERQTSCTTHVSTPFPGPACAHSQSTGHTQRYWSAPKSGTTPPPRNTQPLEQGTVWGVIRSAPQALPRSKPGRARQHGSLLSEYRSQAGGGGASSETPGSRRLARLRSTPAGPPPSAVACHGVVSVRAYQKIVRRSRQTDTAPS